jgi:hypothetical protein
VPTERQRCDRLLARNELKGREDERHQLAAMARSMTTATCDQVAREYGGAFLDPEQALQKEHHHDETA